MDDRQLSNITNFILKHTHTHTQSNFGQEKVRCKKHYKIPPKNANYFNLKKKGEKKKLS